MGAIVPVSAMNKMVIKGMHIILLLSPGVIAAGVAIVYDTLQDWRTIYVPKGSKSNVAYLCIFTIPKSEAMHPYE